MPEDKQATDSGTDIGKRITQTDVEMLKAERDTLKAKLDTITKLHEDALKFIDDQNRAKLAPMILENTKYTVEDINKMSTAEMDSLANTLKMVKRPVAGVGALAAAADSQSMPGLTVGDRFKFDKEPKAKLYEKGS